MENVNNVILFFNAPENKKYSKSPPEEFQEILASNTADDAGVAFVYNYMGQVNQAHEYLQKNGAYSKINSINEQFQAGKKQFKNVGALLEVIKTFNPNGIEKPTDRLRKISGVLRYCNNLTENVPLIGTLIDCYARMVEELSNALDKLDKNTKNERIGSLGGQSGADKIQECFIKLQPESELLTYLKEPYPEIAPVLVFEFVEQHHIFISLTNGSQCYHFSRGTAFNGLYKSYSYLKSIGSELTIDDFLFKARLFSDTQGGGKTLFEKKRQKTSMI